MLYCAAENQLFLKLTAAGSSKDDRKAAAADIVAAVNKEGANKVLKACSWPIFELADN